MAEEDRKHTERSPQAQGTPPASAPFCLDNYWIIRREAQQLHLGEVHGEAVGVIELKGVPAAEHLPGRAAGRLFEALDALLQRAAEARLLLPALGRVYLGLRFDMSP